MSMDNQQKEKAHSIKRKMQVSLDRAERADLIVKERQAWGRESPTTIEKILNDSLTRAAKLEEELDKFLTESGADYFERRNFLGGK